MYGYVKPFVPELKVAEYEKYRAVYCGLCRSMGKLTGQLSRFTLSYDLTYLAIVRMIISDFKPSFGKQRCFVHAVKKRLIADENPALTYSAAVSAALYSAKLDDDISDSAGWKRVTKKLLVPFLSSFKKKAMVILPSGCDIWTEELLLRLSELEKNGTDSPDSAAEAFGEVLGYLFSLGYDGEEYSLAYRIGKYTGRFIYICDAADDLREDIKNGEYNPLHSAWGELALNGGKISDMVKESTMTAALLDLGGLSEAVEKLENRLPSPHELMPILKNTVYLGLPEAMRRALNGDSQIDIMNTEIQEK